MAEPRSAENGAMAGTAGTTVRFVIEVNFTESDNGWADFNEPTEDYAYQVQQLDHLQQLGEFVGGRYRLVKVTETREVLHTEPPKVGAAGGGPA
jgi:hypothetical protein